MKGRQRGDDLWKRARWGLWRKCEAAVGEAESGAPASSHLRAGVRKVQCDRSVTSLLQCLHLGSGAFLNVVACCIEAVPAL